MKDYTGIRQMIVDIVQGCVIQTSIQEGIVKKEDPIVLGLAKDKKVEITKASVIVPSRLEGDFREGDKLHLLVVGNGQYYVLDKA